MNLEQIITLSPDIIDKLRTAVEIGKWENGTLLTQEQSQISMQAVLLWEHAHLPKAKQTGYIDMGKKTHEDHCETPQPKEDEQFKPIRFV